MSDLPPGNDNCGSKCPESERINSFCDDCPVKEAKDVFTESVLTDVREKLPENHRNFSFENLYSSVLDVLEFEDLPKNEITIKTHHLIKILKSERNRIERIQEFNSRESDK